MGGVCGVHHFSSWHSTANANLTLCKAARGSEIWKSAQIQSRALTRYNGLNACVPSKFLCSAPDPQCDGLGGGASWQWFGREGRSLVNEKVNQGAPWPLCTMWGCKGTRSLQSRGDSTPDTKLLAPWSWTSLLPELWYINVCCFSRPVYGTLSQQAELRHLAKL